MTATLNVPIDLFYGLLLVFLRVAAIIFSAPILDASTIPVVFKAGLALAVSVLLLPEVATMVTVSELSLFAFVIGVGSEVAIGVTIGLSVKLLFTGIQLAGQMVGHQMGFAVANVIDPASSMQIPIISQIYNLTAMMLFLVINAHHMFFRAVVESYALLPPLSMHLSPQLVAMIMKLVTQMFVVAIKVGAPLITAMLVVTVGLGLVARTVPQMHIFVVAMPLKILIGLLFMVMLAPYLTSFLIDYFASYPATLGEVIRLMAPR